MVDDLAMYSSPRFLRKLLAVGVVVVLLASAAGAPAARTDRPAELQRALVGMAKFTRAPGGVMLVADGRRVWRGATGLAVKRPRQPMRLDRRFRIASVTKPFVAVVVLQLVSEGKVALTDTLERWLPGAVPGGEQITVRHLLTHTSGLVDVNTPKTGELGTFTYANRNWTLLGSIVEAATGSSTSAELDRRILRPLGLRDTVWPTGPAVVPRLARGYTPLTGTDATVAGWGDFGPAGALVSSAADLHTFLGALFRGRRLSETLANEMRQTVDVGAARGYLYDGYGLGLIKMESRCGTAWGHRGRMNGYTSYAFASADARRQIVVLLNVGWLDDATTAGLNRLVFAAFCA